MWQISLKVTPGDIRETITWDATLPQAGNLQRGLNLINAEWSLKVLLGTH